MSSIQVIAYFGDDVTRTYQVVQWLEVLEILDRTLPTVVVVRDAEAGAIVQAGTSLPVHLALSFPELTDLYAELDASVVLYCNNSPRNFESLLDGRRLHVHVNHGESDKQSMASNNAKAYDRVFVAGEAAVQRYTRELMDFDERRLVRIGRPQLDRRPASPLTPSSSRTVLYAPTWEGDAEYNDYTSVDTVGPEVARAILEVPGARLVYKPHPKVTTSLTPAVRDGHRDILRLVLDAATADPEAGHIAIVDGDILAVIPDCDAIVTDVSSVGLDWLYLRTEQPLFLTDRGGDREAFARDVPVSRCADVVDTSSVSGLSALLTERLASDIHQLSRMAMRHHYFDDLQVGESTHRFVAAVCDLAALRDRLLGFGGAADNDAITA